MFTVLLDPRMDLLSSYIHWQAYSVIVQSAASPLNASAEKIDSIMLTAELHLQDLANSCMQESASKRPSFSAIMDILRPHVP